MDTRETYSRKRCHTPVAPGKAIRGVSATALTDERRVQRHRPPRRLPPGERPGRRAPRAPGQRLPRPGVGEQINKGPVQCACVARCHQPRRPGRGHLAEAADVARAPSACQTRARWRGRPTDRSARYVTYGRTITSARRNNAGSSASETKRGTKRTEAPARARSGSRASGACPRPTARPRSLHARPRAAPRCPCTGAAGRRTAPPAP